MIPAYSPPASPRAGAWMIALSALLFGLLGGVVKHLSATFPPDTIVFFRNAVGLLALVPFVHRAGLRSLATRHFFRHVTARTVSDRILAMQAEKRDIQEFRLPLDAYLDKVKLADGAAKKFYDDNSKQFEVPEQARVEFVVLSMESVGAALAVSDAEIKAWYDGHKDRFQQAEERRASHILIASEKIGKDKAKAKAGEVLKELRKNPSAFADLAKKNSATNSLPYRHFPSSDNPSIQPAIMRIKPNST